MIKNSHWLCISIDEPNVSTSAWILLQKDGCLTNEWKLNGN